MLYRLGEQVRIAGISGFTVHPPQARREKPKVSAFTSARVERILALRPDLVLAYSDLQADLAAELGRAGLEVHLFNQRDVAGILRMIETVGTLVHASDRADRLVGELRAGMAAVQQRAAALPRRPRVYFEEWDDPLIAGIRWVSELIEMAGGEDCFADLSHSPGAMGRRINDPAEVVRRAPDVIVGSWCGKRFRPQQLFARVGWQDIPALVHQQLFEIKSADILQPGVSALSSGLAQLHRVIGQWQRCGHRAGARAGR